MNSVQGWALGLLVAGLVLRGYGGLRFEPIESRFVGVAGGLAVLQTLLFKQVTLDDMIIAPCIVSLPIVAGVRFGVRAGLATGLGTGLVVALLGAVVPVDPHGDLLQEQLVLVSFLLAGTGAAAGSFAAGGRTAIWMPLVWLGFFALREPHLAMVPEVIAMPIVACGLVAVSECLAPRPTADVAAGAAA